MVRKLCLHNVIVLFDGRFLCTVSESWELSEQLL